MKYNEILVNFIRVNFTFFNLGNTRLNVEYFYQKIQSRK